VDREAAELGIEPSQLCHRSKQLVLDPVPTAGGRGEQAVGLFGLAAESYGILFGLVDILRPRR
jgi:hypothetical protein